MRRALVGGVIGVVLLASRVGAQRTLLVPSQFATIDQAIQAANDGDTVRVAPGTYVVQLDFRGKSIVVEGSAGAERTVLRGLAAERPVVVFKRGEGPAAVLRGFTVTGGRPGILIAHASPTIERNIITGNNSTWEAWLSPTVLGGGLSVFGDLGRPPIIVNNVIRSNNMQIGRYVYTGTFRGAGVYAEGAVLFGNTIAENTMNTDWINGARIVAPEEGGGVYCVDCVVVNNVIADNVIYGATIPGAGGGIRAWRSRLINNTVLRNRATSQPVRSVLGSGGGVYATDSEVTNCIIRGNVADWQPQLVGQATYCNIEGGHAGVGNIQSDPRFVGTDDVHLEAASPCIDAGTNARLNLAATDFEWDARGYGVGVDIGADEFAPHVYHVGVARVGRPVEFRVTGRPGASVLLGFAASYRTIPIVVPSAGALFLDPATLVVAAAGTIPANGVLIATEKLPSSFPLGPVPVQALVSSTLTPMHRVTLLP